MSELKATPGPWVGVERFGVIGSIKGGVFREYTNGTSQDQLFMVCCVQDDNGGPEATNANAHLIAAAPDMYAELEAAMNVFRFYQGHHAAKGHSDKEQTNKQYADRIAKVLAKARGEA